jgi:acyl-CoA thioester hydrolase
MSKPAAIPHTFWCMTRWGDLDALGHVNNIKLIQYIQEAIFDLIREGEQDDVFPDGYMIARHEVDYRRQLHHRGDQPLPLQIWVTAIGTNSYTVRTETRRAGETVFEARTVCVARDHRTGMSRPLTEAERAHLSRHRVVEPVLSTTPEAKPGSNSGSNSGPGPQKEHTALDSRRQYLPTDITGALATMRKGWQLWKSVALSRLSA